LDRLKKDYRRLGLEVGSIMIMVLAGGYLLWSAYSYFTGPKSPEPRATISKEVPLKTLPSSSSSTPPAAPVAEPRKSGDTERRLSVSTSSISKEAAPAPPPPEVPKTPSAETPEIGKEVGNIMTLLEDVRQSNLKKDIYLFVSCYASDFQNMEERRRATLAYWEKFNYLDLSYSLKDLSLSAETAKARVEWSIKTSSKNGGQAQQNKSILEVSFKKEDGKWKIKETKPTR
jgi:ketosteroid isomerase-like protein